MNEQTTETEKPKQRGGGRKTRRVEETRLFLLREIVDEAKWVRIVDRAVTDAIDGDDGATRDKARRWIGDYLIGKPGQTVTIRHDDTDRFAQWEDLTDEELAAIAATGAVDIGGKAETERDDGTASAGTSAPD